MLDRRPQSYSTGYLRTAALCAELVVLGGTSQGPSLSTSKPLLFKRPADEFQNPRFPPNLDLTCEIVKLLRIIQRSCFSLHTYIIIRFVAESLGLSSMSMRRAKGILHESLARTSHRVQQYRVAGNCWTTRRGVGGVGSLGLMTLD